MKGNSLSEHLRIEWFLPGLGEELSHQAAGLFVWLMNPYAMQHGRMLYLNKKGTGEHWKQVLCALAAVLEIAMESKDFRPTTIKRSRFEELLKLPLDMLPRDRDSKIHEAFNGTNLDEVMNLFEVSRATVYRAAKKRKSHKPKEGETV